MRDFGRTHQGAQAARAAIECGAVVVVMIQQRLRPAMGKRCDVLEEIIPALAQGGGPVRLPGRFAFRFWIRFRSACELVFHHGTEDKAVPKVVDNYGHYILE